MMQHKDNGRVTYGVEGIGSESDNILRGSSSSSRYPGASGNGGQSDRGRR